VHYLIVHLHSYYRKRSGTGHRLYPKPEVPYEGIVSLSIFPGIDDDNVNDVIETLCKVITDYAIGTEAAAFATAG
jgi:perosamine synthetase